MKRLFLLLAVIAASFLTFVHAKESRWYINGSHSVQWNTSRGDLPYYDHIEMSGLRASVVYYWGVDEKKKFHMDRHLVFPMLRTIPNNTHASWMPRLDIDFLSGMKANGRYMSQPQVSDVTINGILHVSCNVRGDNNDFTLLREYYPSPTEAAVCERYMLKNVGQKKETVLVPATYQMWTTNHENGTRGSYRLVAQTEFQEDLKVTLEPGEEVTFYCTIQAYALADEKEVSLNAEA